MSIVTSLVVAEVDGGVILILVEGGV